MEEGDRSTYPDLARSLELIARDGPSAFYRGEIAQTIHDAMAAHGGLITRADLAAYSVRVGSPLTGTYRGLDLAFAPGATGGLTALEILNTSSSSRRRRSAGTRRAGSICARWPSAARSPIASSTWAIRPWSRRRGIGSRRRNTRTRSPRSCVVARERRGAAGT